MARALSDPAHGRERGRDDETASSGPRGLSHRQVGALWERSAPSWIRLARQGYDVYRDRVNTPFFLAALPEVAGLCGVDLGCGEGHNTRQVAARGAELVALDISRAFAAATRDGDPEGEGGVPSCVGSAVALPFADASFDFATAFMSLQDVPETEAVLLEAARIIRPGGFFQFSICHPCSDTPHREWVRDAEGRKLALGIGDYFDEDDADTMEWLFSAAPEEARRGLEPFNLPRIHRTLSRWLNALVATGLLLEWVGEPTADEETAARYPNVADTRMVPYFLHIRCRKP